MKEKAAQRDKKDDSHPVHAEILPPVGVTVDNSPYRKLRPDPG